jgi:hypothetical protein
VITAVIGTTIFSTLDDNPDPRWKLAAGFITLAGTILSSLQASLGFAQTGQRHKAAGEAYRAMCRKFEMLHLRYRSGGSVERGKAMDDMEKVVAELAGLAGDFPAMPDSCYDEAKKEVDGRRRREERSGREAEIGAVHESNAIRGRLDEDLQAETNGSAAEGSSSRIRQEDPLGAS